MSPPLRFYLHTDPTPLVRVQYRDAQGLATTYGEYSYGFDSGLTIEWIFGTPPEQVEERTLEWLRGDCADCAGVESEREMRRACEGMCARCGAVVDELSELGHCTRCFVQCMGTNGIDTPSDAQIEALRDLAAEREDIELFDACETALKMIVQPEIKRAALKRIAEVAK